MISLAVGVQLDWNRAMVEKLVLPGSKSSRSAHETDNLQLLQQSWIVRYQIFSEGLLVRSMQTKTGHNFVFDDCSADDPVARSSDYATVPEEVIPGRTRGSDLLTATLPSVFLPGYGVDGGKKKKGSGANVLIGEEADAAAEAAAARAGSATTTRLRANTVTGAPEPTP